MTSNSFTLTTLNLPDLHRHFVGFDDIFEDINRAYMSKQDNYPPYNILRLEDMHFLVEIAVAGFRETELDVESRQNEYGKTLLTVRGEKQPVEREQVYLHRGLAARNFERSFTLGNNMEITGVAVENGIMSIHLAMKVPETQRPKKVAITFSK